MPKIATLPLSASLKNIRTRLEGIRGHLAVTRQHSHAREVQDIIKQIADLETTAREGKHGS